MKDSLIKILGTLLFFSMICSCKSPKELLQKGAYDKVLSSLESKAKKGKLSASDKDLFVKSLNGYLNTGKKQLESRFISNEAKDWQEGVDLLNTYAGRQEKYLAYRQILDKDVTAIDVDKWYVAFGEKLFVHHLNKYEIHMADFDQSGDRAHVRKAYYEVENLMDYDDGTLNLDSMSSLCLDLGHREFYVQINNRSFERFNFSYFENDVNLRNTDWASFTNNSSAEYQLIISLEEVYKDEVVESERQRTYTDRVIVGYNTVADTTGTREEPIYEQVQATVREVRYAYRVDAVAQVWIFEGDDQRPIYDRIFRRNDQDIQEQNFFQSGDRRALPSNLPTDNFNPQNYNFDYLVRDVLRDLGEEVSFAVRRL